LNDVVSVTSMSWRR